MFVAGICSHSWFANIVVGWLVLRELKLKRLMGLMSMRMLLLSLIDSTRYQSSGMYSDDETSTRKHYAVL